jgi:hypothetical protein
MISLVKVYFFAYFMSSSTVSAIGGGSSSSLDYWKHCRPSLHDTFVEFALE